MDVLPSGNLFQELQNVADTGYFEWNLSPDDSWQQTCYEMEKCLRNESAECRLPQDEEQTRALLSPSLAPTSAVSTPLFNITITMTGESAFDVTIKPASEPTNEPKIQLPIEPTNKIIKESTSEFTSKNSTKITKEPTSAFRAKEELWTRTKSKPIPRYRPGLIVPHHRVHSCDFPSCNKVFTKVSHMKSHRMIHTREKPFLCSWEGCEWRFARQDELARHYRKHTGAKPFSCRHCQQCFSRIDHQRRHEIKSHG